MKYWNIHSQDRCSIYILKRRHYLSGWVCCVFRHPSRSKWEEIIQIINLTWACPFVLCWIVLILDYGLVIIEMKRLGLQRELVRFSRNSKWDINLILCLVTWWCVSSSHYKLDKILPCNVVVDVVDGQVRACIIPIDPDKAHNYRDASSSSSAHQSWQPGQSHRYCTLCFKVYYTYHK